MADVSHELGALRFVVDSPLSSKVAMFNNQAQQHQQGQLLNPFSGGSESGRSSPKPTFSKDEYGKPLAGSLTEMRGQKANIHVMKEMLELCQIINSEGYVVKNEPTMRVIPFGELFNIYNHISDKVVGILLRARKHKLVEFEGEILFQRRDDNVPVFLLKPIAEVRRELETKIESIKVGVSSAPQATSLLLDKAAHKQKLHSRTPSPAVLDTPKLLNSNPKFSGSDDSIVINSNSVQTLNIDEMEPPKILINDKHKIQIAESEITIETETKKEKEGVLIADSNIEQSSNTTGNSIAEPETIDEITNTSKGTLEESKNNDNDSNENNNNNNNNNNDNDYNNKKNNYDENELPTVIVEATAVYTRDSSIVANSVQHA